MRSLLALSALLLGVVAPTYADTIFTLNNATFVSGASASGTIGIDEKTGLFDSVDITYTRANGNTFLFNTITSQSPFDNGTQQFFVSDGKNASVFLLDLPASSLKGYFGGTVCSVLHPCDGYISFFQGPAGAQDSLLTGNLTQTPEPSSFALLGTGLLGLAGVARKRFARQSS